jgi:hypothetical protein
MRMEKYVHKEPVGCWGVELRLLSDDSVLAIRSKVSGTVGKITLKEETKRTDAKCDVEIKGIGWWGSSPKGYLNR